MEEECGNIDLARRLLQEASEKDPCDLYVWQARPPSQRPRRPAASARWTPGWLPRCCRRRLDVGTLMQLAAQRHQARSQGANAGAAAEPMRGARRPGACWRRARATCRARGSCSSRASGRSRATAASRACGRRRRRPYPNSSRAVCCQPRGCWLGDQLSACAVPRMGGHTVCRLCRSAEPPGLVSVQRSFARAAVPARP